MSYRLRPILLCAILAVMPALTPAVGAESVRVHLASGRVIAGVIDARSSDEALWLRRGDQDTNIARPIQWDRITEAFQNDEAIAIEDLRSLAKAAADDPEASVERVPWQGVFAMPARDAIDAEIILPDVRSFAFDAYHANWDADVESDGLVLIVYPLAADGLLVPVSGSLEVELIAPEVRRFQDAPQGRGLTLERIGQWTVAIAPEDFTPSGIRVELPFQALHPEFDTKILPHGLVHARLVVPGDGTFDSTADFIRIRPWSPLRDKYWRDTGRRFFPSEQTGRPKRAL